MSILAASVLAATLLASAVPPPNGDDAVAAAFVDALRTSDLRPLQRAAPAMNTDRMEWRSVRDLFDRFACVEVESYRVLPSSTTEALEIELTGRGMVGGGMRRFEPLPRLWTLKRNKDGQFIGLVTEAEARIDRALAGATTEAIRADLAEADSISLRESAMHLALRSDCRVGKDACCLTASLLSAEAERREDVALKAASTIALAMVERPRWRPRGEAVSREARYWAAQSGELELDAYVRLLATRVEFPMVGGASAAHVERHRQLLEPIAANAEMFEDARALVDGIEALGNVSFAFYEIPQAFRTYERLGALSRRFGWRRGEIMSSLGLGRVAATIGDYALARKHLQQSADIASPLAQQDRVSVALNLLAQTLMHEERFAEAIPAYERALAAMPPDFPELEAFMRTNLAYCLLQSGRVSEAAKQGDDALAALRPIRSVYLSRAVGFVAKIRHAQGRFDEAMELAREVIRLEEIAPWESDGRTILAQTLLDCGRADEAIEALTEAVDSVERRRMLTPAPALARARYYGEREYLEPYESLINALVTQTRYEDALLVSEKMRARLLADTLYSDEQPLELTADEDARLRAANDAVTKLNRARVAAAGTNTDALEAELRRAREVLESVTMEITLRRAATNRHLLDADDFFDALPRDSRHAAIEFVSSGESVIAFVAREQRVTAVRLSVGRRDLEQHAQQLHDWISTRDARYFTAARTLFDALIAPLQPHLRGAKHLTIVPAPFLWSISFETLLSPARQSMDEQYVIAYAPSLVVADRSARARRAAPKKDFLAFANPTLPSASHAAKSGKSYRNLGELAPLPEAVEEARTIAKLYGARRGDTMIGSAARESFFKRNADDYRIVHFGTHAVAEPGAPLYSALVFAAPSSAEEDGLLELREIVETRLNADVAVLAGCETGGGDVYVSEGAISLAWAFLAAGARTTVVSRWKADSASTARLMTSFHTSLAAHQSPSVALRKARAELRADQRYRHPFYWANFAVVGAP